MGANNSGGGGFFSRLLLLVLFLGFLAMALEPVRQRYGSFINYLRSETSAFAKSKGLDVNDLRMPKVDFFAPPERLRSEELRRSEGRSIPLADIPKGPSAQLVEPPSVDPQTEAAKSKERYDRLTKTDRRQLQDLVNGL